VNAPVRIERNHAIEQLPISLNDALVVNFVGEVKQPDSVDSMRNPLKAEA
jgi:hypothetical protein